MPVISEVKQNILMLLTVMLYESKTNSIQNYSFKVYLDIVTLLNCLNNSYFVVLGKHKLKCTIYNICESFQAKRLWQ